MSRLIERLRGKFDYDPGEMQDAMLEAATQLEAMQAEIDRLKARLLQNIQDDFGCSDVVCGDMEGENCHCGERYRASLSQESAK